MRVREVLADVSRLPAARSYCNTTYKWSCGSDLVWLCTATPTPQLLFATQPCSTLPHSFIVKNPGA